jgi:aconitate hydratase
VRLQGHAAYTEDHVVSFAARTAAERKEYPYMPSRILLQDLTGVPCIVDLAALRSALQRKGGDPSAIEPQIPVDLGIDHSIQLDQTGCSGALEQNMAKEFERNRERYVFLRWGQGAFERLRLLPPGLGICHQLNMEYLASCVTVGVDERGRRTAFPDTCVGTDSHTTMINSMGVLGWGVGGIEAEAAMLGHPIPILLPEVVGLRLTGELSPAATPTDLALTITHILRKKGVVGKFIEFFGPALATLTLADRAPVANMAPEYGATMGFFPIDEATLQYLRMTGRTEAQVDLVARYCREQGLFYTSDTPDPEYSEVLALDLATIVGSIAGPRKPHERISLANLPRTFTEEFGEEGNKVDVGESGAIENGSVVIAAITSCTNTSNPTLLLGAAILAKNAAARGLRVGKHVKTSFAPGSRAAAEYLARAGLLASLEELGFHIAAYGCATCIGNSGPLADEIDAAINANNLIVTAVLSGNRNFEGRIHALTRANYLCSPPLVVAYALAGTVKIDLKHDPLGTDKDGNPVYLADLWPQVGEIREFIGLASNPEIYREVYGDFAHLSPEWSALLEEAGPVYAWDSKSTYIQEPPFFMAFPDEAVALSEVEDAAVLGLFGDFITTDHISPAGTIPKDSPAAEYLIARGVAPQDFNSFGSRRGNHEVMMRGTFGNIRIRNRMVDKEGGWTIHQPSGEALSIYDAAMRYSDEGVPLVVIAGKLYGAGSSRDWAAKGASLLGVKAVIAESFERIHRSNLVQMGVLPLEFVAGESADTHNLTGREKVSIAGIADDLSPGKLLEVTVETPDGERESFKVECRIDTPVEIEYYRHGGILNYVLRGM